MTTTKLLAVLLAGGLAVSVWAAPEIRTFHSLADVRDPAQANTGENVALRLARNEYESFQLSVAVPEPSTLAFVLPALPGITVSLYRACEVAGVPDALVPVADGEALAVTPEKAACFWVSVKSDPTVAPGEYRMSLGLSGAGAEESVPIVLDVVDFRLPAAPPVPFVAGIMDRMVVNNYHGELDSEAGRKILLQWHLKCLEYGISPFFWRPYNDIDNILINYCYPSLWPVADPRTETLLADPRLKAIAVPFLNPDDPEAAELAEFSKLLRRKGWLERSYCYVHDEPRAAAYPRMRERVRKLKAIDPEIPVLVTYFCGPDGEGESIDRMYDLLGEDCDIHSMSYWAVRTDEQFIEKLRNQPLKPTVWPYVCSGPGQPAPNYFLEMSGLQHRFVLWRAWKEHADGFLYWAVNSFGHSATPGGIPEVFTAYPAGDGMLMYPAEEFSGKRLAAGFLPPLASIRLERLRDSLEDWALFDACAAKNGREYVFKTISEVYPAPYQYPEQPADIERVRQKLFDSLGE